MINTFELSQDVAIAITEIHSTPTLVLSLDEIRNNYLFFKEKLPRAKIFYAIKANPNNEIINILNNLGSCFDVASDGEMLKLTSMGILPDKMIYANPVKSVNCLNIAKRLGVNTFTFDCECEIDKMSIVTPGARVLLRIKVESNAVIDLNKKFGADPNDAMILLRRARDKGLDVAGLCFHVGSNCNGAKSYIDALMLCYNIFQQAKLEEFNMRILDIGGGFIWSDGLEDNLNAINACIEGYFDDTEIWAEPGRFICGTSMNLITRVIGETVRNGKQWYWMDDGIYGVFSAIAWDYWKPEFITFKNSDKISATFAGPSCDSLDIIERDKIVERLEIDDLIVIPNAGAYTIVTATNFNGFKNPNVVILK